MFSFKTIELTVALRPGPLPPRHCWQGRGWRPSGGVGMQAALAAVSELVRAGLGRLVRRLGWASGWSVAGGPAACHAAALPVGR